MFDTQVFYSVGLTEKQSRRAIEFAATHMADAEGWWYQVGCAVSETLAMNGTPEVTKALNTIWWWLATLENYVEKYGEGPLTQGMIDEGRAGAPMARLLVEKLKAFVYNSK